MKNEENQETEKTKIRRNRITDKNEAKRKMKSRKFRQKTKLDRNLKTDKN